MQHHNSAPVKKGYRRIVPPEERDSLGQLIIPPNLSRGWFYRGSWLEPMIAPSLAEFHPELVGDLCTHGRWTSRNDRWFCPQVIINGVLYITPRVAYEINHGNGATRDVAVCHHCDRPWCLTDSHHFIGTHADNMADKAMKGRASRMIGEDHPKAKLTTEQVREIRERYSDGGITLAELGEQYGVTVSAIAGVVHRRNWRGVA